MINVILIVHILLAMGLIGSVLLQRSEGGGLGIGGGGGGAGGGMAGFMTGRGTASFLTRTTAILAACFMVTSLVLTIMMNQGDRTGGSLVDELRDAGTPGVVTSGEENPPAEGGEGTGGDTGGSEPAPQVE